MVDAAPGAARRLFIALFPDAPACAAIGATQEAAWRAQLALLRFEPFQLQLIQAEHCGIPESAAPLRYLAGG